jgi:hypothetical protein
LFEKAFDKKEARKIEKVKKNGLMSILLPVGLLLIILGAILYKKEFITAVLNTFMDLTGFVAMVVGLFYFIRFYIGIKKN